MKTIKNMNLITQCIPACFMNLILIIGLLILLLSCKKEEDDYPQETVCATCVTYELKNSWMAMYLSGSSRVTLQEGYIELNNSNYTYKRYYKGFWHSNDAGSLGGFTSDFEKWTHSLTGSFTYAPDYTYLIFKEKDTAFLSPGHWILPVNATDSVYLASKINFFEHFSHDFFSVLGEFVYEAE